MVSDLIFIGKSSFFASKIDVFWWTRKIEKYNNYVSIQGLISPTEVCDFFEWEPFFGAKYLAIGKQIWQKVHQFTLEI